MLLNGDETIEVSSTLPQSLGEGLPPLELPTVKQFFRYYALSSKGTLDQRMTAEALNSQVERFFAGFERTTGSKVICQDRK